MYLVLLPPCIPVASKWRDFLPFTSSILIVQLITVKCIPVANIHSLNHTTASYGKNLLIRASYVYFWYLTLLVVNITCSTSPVQCTGDVGQQQSLCIWQMGLLGVVKWRGVVVYVLGTSVWQGILYQQRWGEGLDRSWGCHCTNDWLLA
jgi:hypothetical protein